MRLTPALRARAKTNQRPGDSTVAAIRPPENTFGGGAVSIYVPVRTVSEANRRDHWAVKAKRTKLQRQATAYMLNPVKRFIPSLPVRVKLVRMSPRLLDDDNAVRSLKAIRDEVAAVLGVDDRDPHVTFEYGQQKHRTPVVWVHITPALAPMSTKFGRSEP